MSKESERVLNCPAKNGVGQQDFCKGWGAATEFTSQTKLDFLSILVKSRQDWMIRAWGLWKTPKWNATNHPLKIHVKRFRLSGNASNMVCIFSASYKTHLDRFYATGSLEEKVQLWRCGSNVYALSLSWKRAPTSFVVMFSDPDAIAAQVWTPLFIFWCRNKKAHTMIVLTFPKMIHFSWGKHP